MKQPHECQSIDEVREGIDAIDRQIITLLASRFEYVKEVVKYKKHDTASIVAEERRRLVLQQRAEWAQQRGLNPEVVQDIYRQLIDYFIAEEMKLIQK